MNNYINRSFFSGLKAILNEEEEEEDIRFGRGCNETYRVAIGAWA